MDLNWNNLCMQTKCHCIRITLKVVLPIVLCRDSGYKQENLYINSTEYVALFHAFPLVLSELGVRISTAGERKVGS